MDVLWLVVGGIKYEARQVSVSQDPANGSKLVIETSSGKVVELETSGITQLEVIAPRDAKYVTARKSGTWVT